jgi:ABC-type transport system substrate-binding protein
MTVRRKSGVAAIAVAVVLSACSSSGSSGSKSPGSSQSPTQKTAVSQGTPDPNGVLRYGQDLANAFSDNFDPGQLQNDCAYTELSLIDQSVTKSQGNDAVVGGVASSWTVDTPTQITFHLQPGMKFSDGEALDAAAVKASLLHTKKSFTRTSLSVIQAIDTPDATTVVVHLTKPQAGDVLWALTYLDGMVYAPNSIAAEAKKPVGSGPFLLSKYQVGQRISLKKNPTSPVASRYELAGVDFVQVGSGPQALTALKSGQVDMIDLTPEAYPAAKADPKIGIAVGQSLDYALIQFRMKDPPFTNDARGDKVRAAMEYAIDRDEINRVVFSGLAESANQLFPKGTAGYDPSQAGGYKYTPAKAKQLLSGAGYPKGVSFKLVVLGGIPTYERMAPLLQSELAKAGFHVQLVRIQPSAILSDFYGKSGANAIIIVNLTNGPALWNNYLNNYTSIGFVANVLGDLRSDVVPLVSQADRAGKFDAATLQKPMQQLSKLVMTKGLEIPIVFEPRMVAYSLDQVGGPPRAPIGQCRSNLEGVFIKK